MPEPMTDQQIANWRDILSLTPIGPYARLMTAEQITAIRDRMADSIKAMAEREAIIAENTNQRVMHILADGYILYHRPLRTWVAVSNDGQAWLEFSPYFATKLLNDKVITCVRRDNEFNRFEKV